MTRQPNKINFELESRFLICLWNGVIHFQQSGFLMSSVVLELEQINNITQFDIQQMEKTEEEEVAHSPAVFDDDDVSSR